MTGTLDNREVAAVHPIEFWTDYQPGPDGQMVAADWVRWVKKGTTNQATTEDKIDRVKRDGPIWDAVRPHYEAWKRGQAAPTDGTPLDAAPFVTREMVRTLAGVHIRTIEDLAGAEDAALTRLGIPGIRGVQAKARAFLDTQRNTAGVVAMIAERDEKIGTMEAEMAEMRATIAELAAASGRRRRTREEVMDQTVGAEAA